MEGEGEGMVAVVQGLQDAGLAVTLMGGRRHGRRRSTAPGIKLLSQLTHAKSSVETSTNGLPVASIDTAAQVCDDRYTSSYKLAHCRARPSSPPVESAEFPPQRAGPSRTQGNFEIRGFGSGEAHSPTQSVPYSPYSLRNTFTSVDRDLLTYSRSSRCAESFAHSLRKYPSLSPNRSISSDLVQRLLVYTQAKNFSKSSYHSKSMRSLRHKTDTSPREFTSKTKLCKSVQTYTKAKKVDVKKVSESPERDEEGRVVGEKDKALRSPKKGRSRSPIEASNRHNTHIDAMYNYLKASSTRRFTPKAADVRYLTDVTKCLRDTLKQICIDRPMVCPNIQNRYCQHRRQHHNSAIGVKSSSDNNNESNECSPRVSTGVPIMSPCESAAGTYLPTCPRPPKRCCYCHKPLPCACSPVSLLKFSTDLRSCNCLEEEDFTMKLEEAVDNWLMAIPVFVNENYCDKSIREDMSKELVEKLKELRGDEDFDEKARQAIAECVNNMPMWYPGDKDNQEMFKNHIIDSLISKLKHITKEEDKFEDAIKKWLDTLNFRSNSRGPIVDKSIVVDELVRKLKPIALNPPVDLRKGLKDEIIEVLQKLPIKAEGDKVEFINMIADNLANELQKIPATAIGKSASDNLEDEFHTQILEWLEDMPELSSSSAGSIKENQELIGTLAKELWKIQTQGIDKPDTQKQMENKIVEWLENNIAKKTRFDSRAKNKFVEKLMGKLVKACKQAAEKKGKKSSDAILEDMIQEILDWLQDIPELTGGNQMENIKMVEPLAKKLLELRNQGKDDTELKNEILNWLANAFEDKEPINIRKQNHLISKLLDKIKKLPFETADSDKNPVDSQENMVREILDWLKEIPELASRNRTENLKMIEALAKTLLVLHNQGKDDSELEDQISNWLANAFEDKGEPLDIRRQNNLVSKLLGRIKKIPDESFGDNNLAQDIFNCLEDVPGFDTSCKENKKIVEQLAKEIQNLQLNKPSYLKAKEDIEQWVEDLVKHSGLKLTPAAKYKLVQKLMDAIPTAPKQRKRWNKQDNSSKLLNALQEGVCYILDKSDIPSENRSELEATLTDILADQVMLGKDDNQTKSRLINALADVDISEDICENTANELVDMAKEMSLIYKTSDSITFRRNSEITPIEKEIFQESAEREILGFTQEISGDDSTASRKKWKAAAQELAEKVGDIILEPNTTLAEQREGVEKEIAKYLDDLSIQIAIDEQASELAGRLQNLALKTSTPKRSSTNEDFIFRSRNGSQDPTLSTIKDMSQMMRTQPPSKKEQQYSKELANIIEDWIDNLPIDLNTEEGKGFKNAMIKDLAGDIVDRQKYLQLNPDAKTSDEEELEHLKYQVFRWLNKLPDVKNLKPSIAMTDDLMQSIQGVPVPQLVKADGWSGKRRTRESSIQYVSKDLASLQNEIFKWIDAVPLKYLSSKDKIRQREMVKELAEQLEQLRQDGMLTKPIFEEIVSTWLENMLKNANDKYVSGLVEGLQGILVNKDLISFNEEAPDLKSSVKAANIKETFKKMPTMRRFSVSADSVKDVILKWSENLPFQPGKNIRHAQHEVEPLTKKIKEVMTDVPPENLEDVQDHLDTEIKSFLNKIPVQKHKITDDHVEQLRDDIHDLVKTTAAKNIDTFGKTPAMRKFSVNADNIKAAILKWFESLPIQPGKNIKHAHHEVEPLSKRIKEVVTNVPPENLVDVQNDLDSEIKDFLDKLPIQNHKITDDHVQQLKYDIHDLVKATAVKDMPDRSKFSISADGIKDAILKWSENLPFKPGKTIEDAPENVEPFSKKIKEILKQVPPENLDYVSSDLEKEIKSFLNKLPVYQHKITDDHVEELKDNLRNVVKTPAINNVDTFDKMLAMRRFSVSADGIKDAVQKWSENLPFQPGKNIKHVQHAVEPFSKKIKDVVMNVPPENFVDIQEDLDNEIKSFLNKLPVQRHKIRDDHVDQLRGDIQDLVKDTVAKKPYQYASKHADKRKFSISADGIKDAILKWSENLPFQPGKNIRHAQHEVEPFTKKIKEVMTDVPPENLEDIQDYLDTEIKSFLNKIPVQKHKITDDHVEQFRDDIHDLAKAAAAENNATFDKAPNMKSVSISADGIKDAILKWSKNLPFQSGKNITHAQNEVKPFLNKIKGVVTNVPPEKLEDIQEDLENEIKSFLNKLPVQRHKITDDHVEKLRDKINDLVKATTDTATKSISSEKPGFKKAADFLYKNIENWCENLLIPEGDTPEEKEKVKTIKQEIASKLINVIGDLNMNPDIFNDDKLYEDVLNDEIDNILSSIPSNPELDENLPGLKKDLIEKIKEAKQMIKDEHAGQAYKQQLRDVISTTLPSADNLSVEEQAPFEVLKDNLADAYIELHHAAEDDDAKKKLKNKIKEEIDQFCNEYLKQYPNAPLDANKLNRDLFNALQKVPIPKDKTIKDQVEEVRIKDEINEWLKELPLKEDETPLEQMQRNKIVSYLAKRLHEIEKEKEFESDIDVEERMKKEINKWIKKLPIEEVDEDASDEIINKLIDRLKDSEQSRILSISHIRHSADLIEEDSNNKKCCCSYYQPKSTPPSCMRHLSRYPPLFPLSTLSTEDKAHLQRIRERNEQTLPFKPSFPPCCCKDASVSPIPMDTGSQTDVGQWQTGSSESTPPCCMPQGLPCNSCKSPPVPCGRPPRPPCEPPSPPLCIPSPPPCGPLPPPCGSPLQTRLCPKMSAYTPCPQAHHPLSPQVVINEYNWDSLDSNIEISDQQEDSQPYLPPQYQTSWPQSQIDAQPGRITTPRQSPCPSQYVSEELDRRIGSPQPSPVPRKMHQYQSNAPPPCMSSSPHQSMTSQRSPCQIPPSPRPPCMPRPLQKPCQPPPRPKSPCMMGSGSPYSMQQSCPGKPSPCMHEPPPRLQPPCMMNTGSPFSMQQPCPSKPILWMPEPPRPKAPCMVDLESPYLRHHPCKSPEPQLTRPCIPQASPSCTAEPFSNTIPNTPPCMPQPPCQESRRNKPPRFGSPVMSSASSPFDSECPEIGTSRTFRPRVTRLGSLDDVPFTKTCGSQSPRAKRSAGSPDEDFEWTIRFPEECSDFWGSPCARRRPLRRSRDGSLIREKERKEERVRCHCRERVLTKCRGRRPPCGNDGMKHCPKCCGVHCPHPSYMYFG